MESKTIQIIAIIIAFFALAGGIYLLVENGKPKELPYMGVVPSDGTWRCDKWRFNGLNQTRLISGTNDLTEADILAIQYYCDNLRPTSVYEKCQLLYAQDGSEWGFDYVLKNGTNNTIRINRQTDCVEWVHVKTRVN